MSLTRALREIRANYSEPYWWQSRFEHRVVAGVQQLLYGNDGVHVVNRDWDTLLVLDAARSDAFENVYDINQFDAYKRVTSLGGSTPEWTQRNFTGKKFGDIVYVTGNPQISKYAGDSFHDTIEVWDSAFDDELRTVRPERMVDAALDAIETYPNKRIIVHFMQPHTPYLHRDEVFPDGHNVTKELLDDSKEELKTMVQEVGLDAVWEAYRRNLEITRDSVIKVMNNMDGRTVVTSDHGELFGERVPPFYTRIYGHKSGIRYPDLVDVPWAVADRGTRRRIRDEGVNITDSDTERIENQLEMLGYR